MTVALIVQCNGTPADRPGMALESCRAFLPTRATTIDEARAEALGKNWGMRWDPDMWPAPSVLQDLCPSCVRALTKETS